LYFVCVIITNKNMVHSHKIQNQFEHKDDNSEAQEQELKHTSNII